jgi:filamentous hemagglutinin family protein
LKTLASLSRICRGALALTGGLLLTPFALSEPLGGQVSAGVGSVTQSGATTTIQQASPNLSLNWKSFNIAPQETVNFVQPSATAVAVNRIFDTNGTQILGRLNANGQVYLINPNGILFGQGAQVNVGALVASTLGFNDASLNGSSRTFSGTGTGSIVNQGTINATGSGGSGGFVALLGNNVSNQGAITAPQGTVALGAGSSTTLTFQNNSLLKMQVDQSVLNTLADNGGLIRADGGLVLMSAGAKDALLASVVNNTGFIEARTVQEHNGTIILLGGMTAGTVHVGGTLDASAPNGGHGGFIETSAAHVNIATAANITTAAPAGNTGTWLIDPVDFTIAEGSAALTTSGIGASTLSTSLGSSNVSIATSATTGGNGDIFVNSAVSWSANKLTLNAHRNININANLNATSTASLALNYGLGAVAAGNTSNITTAPGAVVNLPAGTTNFTTQQGSNGAVKTYTVITSLGLAGSTTTTDLQGMGNLSADMNYALGSNIDAAPTALWNGGAGFMPIGSGEAPLGKPFISTFDGLGHTISSLTINRPLSDSVGLFGRSTNSSSIRNVSLVDARVTGRSGVGGLVGTLWNNSTIWNSNATGGATVGTYKAGGLVGNMQGDASNERTTVSQSYATGTVSGMNNIGGLVGFMGVNTDVSNSYATGAVASTGTHAGGLVGGLSGTISNSYATGAVSGKVNVGGLVGWNLGEVSNSYATGTLTGSNVDGLVGLNAGSVNSVYWNTDTAVSSWGTGLTSVQMLHKRNFTGFDFTVTPVWGRNAAVNSGRPILCAFGACITTVSVYAEPVTSFSSYTSTPVFTHREVDVNGSDLTLINAAASYGSGQGAVADVTQRIGNNGSTLQIVTGGIRLPVNLPELNE